MRRNFLRSLLICLAPTLLAGVYVARGFYRESQGEVGFRRGIDLAGGTILVYEVNLDATRSRMTDSGQAADASEGLSSDEIKKLAENLKRRIDPNDLKNVVVRPVGNSRVEIILPYTGSSGGSKEGATEDFVQEVKGLVRQVGVLEFRIPANAIDDADGIRDARQLLETAAQDPKVQEQLDAAAKAGVAPPAPDNTYTVIGGAGLPDVGRQGARRQGGQPRPVPPAVHEDQPEQGRGREEGRVLHARPHLAEGRHAGRAERRPDRRE
jgi:SecD/SecF fusion protein